MRKKQFYFSCIALILCGFVCFASCDKDTPINTPTDNTTDTIPDPYNPPVPSTPFDSNLIGEWLRVDRIEMYIPDSGETSKSGKGHRVYGTLHNHFTFTEDMKYIIHDTTWWDAVDLDNTYSDFEYTYSFPKQGVVEFHYSSTMSSKVPYTIQSDTLKLNPNFYKPMVRIR